MMALGLLADLLLKELSTAPDPDAALVGFSRYLEARDDKVAFLSSLRAEPQTLHVLAQILGSSVLSLSEMLVRRPEYFEWLLFQIDRAPPGLLESDLDLAPRAPHAAPLLDALKRFNGRHVHQSSAHRSTFWGARRFRKPRHGCRRSPISSSAARWTSWLANGWLPTGATVCRAGSP